ncbi:phosphatidic acid phosphatase [Trypanosoma brucei equiperdum]|uniref:Phosphatidic acid phosphatase n=1 Tax=Trypanosoma brucei equiperdum TaxID=630700 RepID=A0A3L6KXI5_9TRYP|nr:phosphatidic acid phosphatase [Trypanosoma brucei equiperdum]
MATGGRSSFAVYLYCAKVLRLLDYLVAFCFGATGFLLGRLIRPYCRTFSWDDLSISNSFAKKETFPDWSLVVMALLSCLFIFIIEKMRERYSPVGEWYMDEQLPEPSSNSITSSTNVLSEERAANRGGASVRERNGLENLPPAPSFERKVQRKFIVDQVINLWILSVVFAFFFSLGIVDVLKIYAGRLRPDFLDRLRREGFNATSSLVGVCDHAREGRLSFPSGHSSCAFAAFTPLTMYFLGLSRAFNSGPVWRIILSMFPIYLAICVAASRTRDNRHHFSDILGGSVIGLVIGAFSVNIFFRVRSGEGYLVPRRLEPPRRRSGSPNDNDTV